ncbi:unnamed protein product [Calypogeia fissa]
MAMWMPPGAEPMTEEEKADFAAMDALREEAVVELKEEGNEFLKKGKKHSKDALDCYTRAIDQKSANVINNSVLYANRSQVNLLLGNYRRAITDAEDAIKLNPANVKAYYRGAKAALALNLWAESNEFCSGGLKYDPMNDELKKLQAQGQQKLAEEAERKKRSLEIKSRFEALLSTISKRNLQIGKALYKERTGPQIPFVDRSGILHWPVLLLYGEVMVSDLIEDFPETDMFRSHIEVMFPKDAPPLDWVRRKEYSRDRIELYYQVNAGPALSRKELLNSMMEGEVGLEGLDMNELASDDSETISTSGLKDPRWVKVDEKMTLHDVLTHPNHIIPGVPAFYGVASGTSFREKFLGGRWSAP